MRSSMWRSATTTQSSRSGSNAMVMTWVGVSAIGQASVMSSRIVRRKRPIRPVSMALTQTSPSPCAAWPSPTENNAVHVAAELARLDARHRAPGARRRIRHHAEERAQRDLGAPGQPAHHAVALQRHMDHPWLGKIIGQGALERTDRGVTPVVMESDILDVDLQHLA